MMPNRLGFLPPEEAILGVHTRIWHPDRRDRRRQQIIERVVAQLDLPYSFVEREMELEEKVSSKPCVSATLTTLVARAAWAKEVWPDHTVEPQVGRKPHHE